MSDQKDENLNELFEQFYSPVQAKQAADDVREVEQIFSRNPAPEPDKALIADTKSGITQTLQQRSAFSFKAVAVAAVITVAAVVGVTFFQRVRHGPEKAFYAAAIPETVWETDDLTTEDSQLAIVTTELAEIEDQILAVHSAENGGNGQYRLAELETELMEIDSDFWKG